MAESRPDIQQVIEVPVNRDKGTGMNLGNLVLVGGLGYVLFKTFLLEERVNDLTVLLKRQSAQLETRSRDPIVVRPGPEHHPEDEYETSDDDNDDDASPERRTHTYDDDDEDGEDGVRIEEQPREVPPPAEIPTRDNVVVTPSTSAFVTTRQRRSGSELRRDSSRTHASTREA